MNKRVNIVLPDKTFAVQGKRALRQRLKQEALANAERDVAMAADWFPLEEEAASAPGHREKKRKTKRS